SGQDGRSERTPHSHPRPPCPDGVAKPSPSPCVRECIERRAEGDVGGGATQVEGEGGAGSEGGGARAGRSRGWGGGGGRGGGGAARMADPSVPLVHTPARLAPTERRNRHQVCAFVSESSVAQRATSAA